MKANAKFVVLNPSLNKTAGSGGLTTAAFLSWLALFLFFFIFTFAFTVITRKDAAAVKTSDSAAGDGVQLPQHVFDALLHYASLRDTPINDTSINATSINATLTNDTSINATSTNDTAINATSYRRMTLAEMETVISVLRSCTAPCNFLVFGLTYETLLWNALNHKGRTVFVDENSFFVSEIESKHPPIEVYDVEFTMKVEELYDLIEYYKREMSGECRPVQNLLFSECKLAINDLPNHLYDVPWDVILIDGRCAYSPEETGRMTAIFTAGVLARSKRGGSSVETHVLVHEVDRELERVCTDEFLCSENLVEIEDSLGHFVVEKMENDTNRFQFCSDSHSIYKSS